MCNVLIEQSHMCLSQKVVISRGLSNEKYGILQHVTLSHLRSKEPPGLHFEMYTGLQLGSDYIDVEAEIDCEDRLILT